MEETINRYPQPLILSLHGLLKARRQHGSIGILHDLALHAAVAERHVRLGLELTVRHFVRASRKLVGVHQTAMLLVELQQLSPQTSTVMPVLVAAKQVLVTCDMK